MKILYLYAELMGYQIPVLKEYTKKYNAEVHVIHWDHKKLTPYKFPDINNVFYYNKSELKKNKLVDFVIKLKPDIIYVSGWMDKDYISACKILRKQNVPVVAGCDTPWRGSLKQILGLIYFRVILKKAFSHLWAAGPYQYEYARYLGFPKKNIIFNCLTADLSYFKLDIKEKENGYPRKFLYIGRFEEIKGLKLLIDAWNKISDKRGWTLTLIGNGTLNNYLKSQTNVDVKDFMQPSELVKEVSKYGCFILPSLKEPWGLVIHEFCAAGFPIITANNCGAAPLFVIPNFNGFLFDAGNTLSLQEKMERMMELSDEQLFEWGINSQTKSTIISPEITAASFISVLKNKL